jgi:hypothetical protein
VFGRALCGDGYSFGADARGRRAGRRRRIRAACGALVVVCGTACPACASAPGVVPLPTFAASASAPTSAPSPLAEPGHRLPADCEQLAGHDELAGLFGLPMDSVAVRTVQGTRAPAVGRVERMTCTYTVSEPAAPPQRGVVLQMTVGAYRDAAAARDQHERNVADQRAGASSVVQPELGAAAATLVRRGAENVLLSSFDGVTLDLDLGWQPPALPPADLLVDLARRVWARLAPDRSPDSPGRG